MKKFREWIEQGPLRSKKKSLSKQIIESGMLETEYYVANDVPLKLMIAEQIHIHDLIEIQKKCYGGSAPWDYRALKHEIMNNPNSLYLVLYDGDQPVGFIGTWYMRSEGHISNICTIPEFENNGIATYLIGLIIKIMNEYSYEILTLEVRISNERAQKLYRKLGFTDGNVKKNYYSDNKEDALDMIMFL